LKNANGKIMIKTLAVILFFCCTAFAGPIENWQEYEVSVRDAKISKEAAVLKLKALVPELSSYVISNFEINVSTWAFPLENYGRESMDKRDFKPRAVYGPYGKKGYDFFDGNRHGGHPAHDIFINDRNRDCLDDKTKKAVNVLSTEDGVVLSVNKGWKPGSLLRGGNYIWLYNPKDNKFFYYAHLNDIFVKPGEIAKRGRAIGTVGRTGRLADKKASPTHVHLMVLEYRGGEDGAV
jgi:peptidoglycan LD-endopeptidase LytH